MGRANKKSLPQAVFDQISSDLSWDGQAICEMLTLLAATSEGHKILKGYLAEDDEEGDTMSREYGVAKRSGWDSNDPWMFGPPITVATRLTLEQARQWIADDDKRRQAVLNDTESLSWEKKQARNTRLEIFQRPW